MSFHDVLVNRDGREFDLRGKLQHIRPLVERTIGGLEEMFDTSAVFEPENSDRRFMLIATDYVISEIAGILVDIVHRTAPNVRVEFRSLPTDELISPEDLLQHDLIIGGA